MRIERIPYHNFQNIYHKQTHQALLYFKQKFYDFKVGLVISDQFECYRIIYNFASKVKKRISKEQLNDNIDQVTSIGRYCLTKIFKAVPLPKAKKPKFKLKLVVDTTGAS